MQRIVIWTCLYLLLILSASASGFRAAAVKVDITPTDTQELLGYMPRNSTEVHDPLFHRILVLESGGHRLALVSSDLGAISPAFYDDLSRRVEEKTGIPRDSFWWMLTHTHSAPVVGDTGLAATLLARQFDMKWDEAYAEKVRVSMIEGIEQAISELEPAYMGVGTGSAMANMNRRARDVDGSIHLGLNPYGPVDRQIGLIRLEKEDGSFLALIVNYAMHGTFLAAVPQISGDAPGIVASYLEEKLGGPVLYINGAAGNVAPLYYFRRGFNEITQMNVLLGDRVLEANRSIRVDRDAPIGLEATEVFVETDMRTDIEWPESLSRYSTTSAAGTPRVRIPVRILKLRKDLALWAAPLELFSEVAIRVRSESPFSNTFYFGYANGWLGYLPTRAGFEEGGYEARISPYTGSAERDLGDSVIQLLYNLE